MENNLLLAFINNCLIFFFFFLPKKDRTTTGHKLVFHLGSEQAKKCQKWIANLLG